VNAVAAVQAATGATPDPDPDPTPSASQSTSPSTSPTASPTGGTQQSTRYYFHSASGLGNFDFVDDSTTFDDKPPTFAGASEFFDVSPLQNGVHNDAFDPYWIGDVDETIEGLEVDFWSRMPVGRTFGRLDYDISVWVGDTQHAFPTLTVEVPPGTISNGYLQIKHKFTEANAGDVLPIVPDDPATTEEEPVSISIAAHFGDFGAGSSVSYDSTTRQSGFTVFSAGPDPTESPTESPTPVITGTTTEFTADSATGGQYSDGATIAADLSDESGNPLASKELVFELIGEHDTKTWSATTNDAGMASKEIQLDFRPGSYALSVRYDGEADTYAPSADATGFVIDKEDSAAALSISSSGSQRSLEGTVTETDTDEGLAGLTVEFLDNGEAIGTAETDSQGVATIDLPTASRAKQDLEAVFAGDDYYLSSSDDYTLIPYALVSGGDLELGGSHIEIQGTGLSSDLHSNRNVKIGSSNASVCGDISAVGRIENKGTQCEGYSSTAGASPVAINGMADLVPATSAATQTLSGDRTLNGYNCPAPTGCVVWVRNGKLEIRGSVTGDVFFLVDKEAIIKGNLVPADNSSSVSIYSKLNVEASDSKAMIDGVFLAEKELKLSGSDQDLTGLFWAKDLIDAGGSKSSLTGAMISGGLLKLGGSHFSFTYDPDALGLN
jgi:hypothetical protein